MSQPRSQLPIPLEMAVSASSNSFTGIDSSGAAADAGCREMKINFRGGEGMVIVRSDRIDSISSWAKSQIAGFNLANVALLIAVIVVSASISSTLNTQREQNAIAQNLLQQMVQERQAAQIAVTAMTSQLRSSDQLAGVLNTSIAEYSSQLMKYNLTAVSFNSTLAQAIALGLPNLTDNTGTYKRSKRFVCIPVASTR